MTQDYQPEGVKYTFPDDDPYQESNEIYYNMVDFLDDSEVHQICLLYTSPSPRDS